ncbi:MAG: GlcNAc-PI de-N-acetylase [Herpetosiphonaceae bacterium]|nr:MAG: GlcNAc-PI de-N-acetylase [Herpetosiphonaceae bacterium]
MSNIIEQQRTGGAMPNLSAYGITSEWQSTAQGPRRMLIVYAHPDDESFGNAGTIARYTAEGVVVHYACATRGECGTVAPAFLQGHTDIAALRSAELACAARTLGLAAVHHLNYRDSGMPGSADNQHPAALIQAPQERVIGQITALMRLLRPQVVVTFGPYGGYGHPDHIFIHNATVSAFAAAGDPARYPEQITSGLAAWQPTRLYYSTFGARALKLTVAVLRLLGKDPRRFGENQDVDLLRALAEVTPVTTAIGCGAYLEQKERAWRCHQSQLGGGIGRLQRLPASIRRLFAGAEYFTRAVPAWDGRRRREHDLFEGVVV